MTEVTSVEYVTEYSHLGPVLHTDDAGTLYPITEGAFPNDTGDATEEHWGAYHKDEEGRRYFAMWSFEQDPEAPIKDPSDFPWDDASLVEVSLSPE